MTILNAARDGEHGLRGSAVPAPRVLVRAVTVADGRVFMPAAEVTGTLNGGPARWEAAMHTAVLPGTPPVSAPVQPIRSALRHLDAIAVSAAARQESRNRERFLPPTGVYRWWARRTAAVNGAIVDAVARDMGARMTVSDPFSGGGVIPLVALLRGHDVYAQDVNEWAATGLQAMLTLPPADVLREAINVLSARVADVADAAYATVLADGTPGFVSHTFRVATGACTHCGTIQRLYPHAMVSLRARRESGGTAAFLACRNGHLFAGDTDAANVCPDCGVDVDADDVYTRYRFVVCGVCGRREKIEHRVRSFGLRWETVLVERSAAKRRELAVPTEAELRQAAEGQWAPKRRLGPIRHGHETRVLLRHGFTHWEDLYPSRQRWFLETLLELVDDVSEDSAVRDALRTAIIGATEMAGFVSRWDRYYLKSFETMANHRFNFTTFAAEPNVWGAGVTGRGTVLRRLTRLVSIAEWLTDRRPAGRRIDVAHGSSERQRAQTRSVHLALTDPPYHDDVQYSELSLPLRAWSGMAMHDAAGDASVNPSLEDADAVGILTRIFRETARTLRDDGHLIFSFANRDPRAWIDLITALHDAGLRTVGAEIVHSENESDAAKRQVRACTLDLIIDLVPAGSTPVEQYRPRTIDTDEGKFLGAVSEQVLQVGALLDGWEEPFRATLFAELFLTRPEGL